MRQTDHFGSCVNASHPITVSMHPIRHWAHVCMILKLLSQRILLVNPGSSEVDQSSILLCLGDTNYATPICRCHVVNLSISKEASQMLLCTAGSLLYTICEKIKICSSTQNTVKSCRPCEPAGSRCCRCNRNSVDTGGKGGQPQAPHHSVRVISSGMCHELPVLLHRAHGAQVLILAAI